MIEISYQVTAASRVFTKDRQYVELLSTRLHHNESGIFQTREKTHVY